MSALKFGAHPLMVAVAMGFLGPGAVLDEPEERVKTTTTTQQPQDLEEPTAEDFARVENLWHEVRTLV